MPQVTFNITFPLTIELPDGVNINDASQFISRFMTDTLKKGMAPPAEPPPPPPPPVFNITVPPPVINVTVEKTETPLRENIIERDYNGDIVRSYQRNLDPDEVPT